MENPEIPPASEPTPTEVPPASNSNSNSNSNDHGEASKAEEEQPTHKYTGVKDYGVSSDQNPKYRRKMEDAHYCEDGFNGDPEQAFFGVYDGHGGNMAANFCAERLHKVSSSLF